MYMWSDLPTPSISRGLTSGSRGGETDGFVIVLNPDLSTILASRYLGGSEYDIAIKP